MSDMLRARVRAVVTAVVLGTVGCAPADENAVGEHEAVVHWGYQGEEGPEHWAELSDDFALCGSGTVQSPIDLGAAVPMAPGAGTEMQRDYGTGALSIARHDHVVDVLDNGHTIQVTYEEGSTLTVGRVEYELLQFHFHAPSEHTIDGGHYPMELHLVHRAESGELAVLGVFIEEGESNPAFDALIEGLPSAAGEERRFTDVEIEVDAFISSEDEYYRYEGSLTTPPCSEGVHWAVLTEPLHASAEQIAALDAAMPANNRPVQALGSREVALITQ
jgi:carbonic anhydrase